MDFAEADQPTGCTAETSGSNPRSHDGSRIGSAIETPIQQAGGSQAPPQRKPLCGLRRSEHFTADAPAIRAMAETLKEPIMRILRGAPLTASMAALIAFADRATPVIPKDL